MKKYKIYYKTGENFHIFGDCVVINEDSLEIVREYKTIAMFKDWYCWLENEEETN